MLATLQSFDTVYVSVKMRIATLKMFNELLQLEPQTIPVLERSIALVNYWRPLRYIEHAKRLCFNLHQNPALLEEFKLEEVCTLSDERMTKGTIVQRYRDQERSRMEAIQSMLKEKYEDVTNQSSTTGLIRCRACGSCDISWEQKQTRGADEAMTIFCSCTRCKSRWKMS